MRDDMRDADRLAVVKDLLRDLELDKEPTYETLFQGLIAVNTSRAFEKDLLKKYVEKNAKTLELRALDTRHDETIFQTLTEEEQRRFRALIGYERSEGVEALEEFLIQPRVSEGFGQLADEALQKLRESPVTLYLNANNDIVRRLAEEQGLEERRFELLLVGLSTTPCLPSKGSTASTSATARPGNAALSW